MDSGCSSVLAAGQGQGDVGGGDKLSRLGDAALGHILSFLPATEAARTSTLSRRWRHIFAAVHTLSFGEAEAPLMMGYRWWRRCSYCDNGDMRAPRFVAGVSAALHGRHQAAHAATKPLRTLRVTFDEFGFRGGQNATTAVDGWLSYAVRCAGDELDIDARFNTEPICEQAYALASGRPDDAKMEEENATADEEEPCSGQEKYILPKNLFSSCATLRALRLGGCSINLPSAIALPSLHTLHLTRVTGRRGTIEGLVSACPSLVDLTLEACGNLTELCINGACLGRLALRWCHGLASVKINSLELQSFEYRGAIPAEPPSPPFLTMHYPRKISFCAIDFCGVERAAEVFDLMELFVGVERLHLTSARLGSSFVSHDGTFPCFLVLRNLEITGMLPDYDGDASAAILTLARILERTPMLETLSLFFLAEPDPVKDRYSRYIEKQVFRDSHKLRYNPYACLAMTPSDVEAPCCLRETTRVINLATTAMQAVPRCKRASEPFDSLDYDSTGSVAQRALAKYLLCNAPVVDEVCWKVAPGPLSIQTKLMEEIRGWVRNKSANMMFF